MQFSDTGNRRGTMVFSFVVGQNEMNSLAVSYPSELPLKTHMPALVNFPIMSKSLAEVRVELGTQKVCFKLTKFNIK